MGIESLDGDEGKILAVGLERGAVGGESQANRFTDGGQDTFSNGAMAGSFAKAFAEESRAKIKSQREVVLDQYSLDELKLVGIVTRVRPERALIIDPTGKGHIVTRGQFVGRGSSFYQGPVSELSTNRDPLSMVTRDYTVGVRICADVDF